MTLQEVSRLKGSTSVAALIAVLAVAIPSYGAAEMETVTVTGYRASLESALNTKRASTEMVDSINAEDVAKFPDANLAESLQRLAGVSVARDNGEGRTITVRGLGADFTRVTINGMEALATAGGTLAGDNPNRSRQFDFNTFASELFNQLTVKKTASASTDEGSLGATVSLQTGHPLDMGNAFVASLNNATYERGAAFNPRIAGLASHTFFDGKVGALVSVAYNMRRQALDYYTNGAGGYVYIINGGNGSLLGTTPVGTMTRDGFAAPTGTACNGADGVVPGVNITNASYCALLSGSDPSVYSAVNSPRGHTTNSAGTWTTPGPMNELGGPALVHQKLYQTRIGITTSEQWRVDENTLVSFDGLFSSYYQNSVSDLVTNLGLARNNTSATLATATAATNVSGAYGSCTAYDSTNAQVIAGVRDVQGCSYTKSLLPWQYHTTVGSPGYSASDPNGMKYIYSTIGRPAMRLVKGQVDNGIVDYLVTDNNDTRTDSDQTLATTQFSQGTIAASHDFSSKLHVDAMFGMAASRNHQEGLFSSMESLDTGSASGDGNYIYDIRGNGDAPVETSFGFDMTNPAKWDMIKGYSALRRYLFLTSNKFRNTSVNISYRPIQEIELKFGFNQRIYDFSTSRAVRIPDTTFNPSLQELGVTSSSVMQLVQFDAGELGMSGKTPTAFLVPDNYKLAALTGLRCNCVNEWGDWRISTLNSQNSSSNRSTSFGVSEHDKSYYLEAGFEDINIAIGSLRGNIGVRYATTDVFSTGYTVAGYLTKATNSYDDVLPSLNLVYSPADDMMVRFGLSKVMSRPVLANMAPTITSVSISSQDGGAGSLSSGNPYLKPFRANAVDISYEWYFSKGSLISVAVFAKFVKNNPQSQSISGTLPSLISPEMIAAMASNYAQGTIQYNNIMSATVPYTLTSYQNAPGGVLKGIELNYQQQLDFLPAPFDGFGINANYTYVASKMHYLFREVGSTALIDHFAPWFGSSPNSFNATLYYTAENWEARVSGAYRSKYVDTYPVKASNTQLGYGNSPSISEFVYGKDSFYLDTSASYDLTENLSFKVDALNLTNQHNQKFWLVQNKTPRETYDSVSGRQVFVGVTLKY